MSQEHALPYRQILNLEFSLPASEGGKWRNFVQCRQVAASAVGVVMGRMAAEVRPDGLCNARVVDRTVSSDPLVPPMGKIGI